VNEFLSFLSQNRIQAYSIAGCVFLILLIIRLIQNRKLKEEYGLLWLAVFFLGLVISIFRPILEWLAALVGIFYAPTALLLFLVLGILMVLIHYSTVLSKLSEQNKTLIQEVAILKEAIRQNKKDSSHD
jgi:hypothetical protein